MHLDICAYNFENMHKKRAPAPLVQDSLIICNNYDILSWLRPVLRSDQAGALHILR